MSDQVAQTDRAAQSLRQLPIDRFPISQQIESRTRVVGRAPPRIGKPMGRQIDTLLNGKKKIKAGQVLALGICQELFR